MKGRTLWIPILLALLAGGGWYLVRARIAATALAGSATDQPRLHQHQPPHGGTPVVLGDDQFNLELVRDPGAGTLRVFVLDGEMEEFVRIPAKVLLLQVQRGGIRETLRLAPVADLATGETVGDTSLFQARAAWLKDTPRFQGAFQNLEIRGQRFPSVAFRFPVGNDRD